MSLSKYAYVVWWPEHEPHGHMLQIGDGVNPVEDAWVNIEDFATELAESVARCNEDRHQGHGRHHSPKDVQRAFSDATQQLLTKDFEAEHAELSHRAMVNKKWGGQAPAAVLFPDRDDPKKWRLVMPDGQGNPVLYNVKDKLMNEIVPSPSDKNADWDRAGVGWQARRRLKPQTKLRRLQEKGR